ncbi:MAG: pirin family protein [Alphaproteobacteria bacterium]|nr:pirin family protein [Alphaproteobacteria bacterium]
MQIRQPAQVVTAMATQEGAGVTVHRALGTPLLPDADPFLMLDEFKNDDPKRYMAGFPDHPHRGMETVTYMLAGAMRHKDNQGNEGKLRPGDVQWMTAGRGIIHSEMPEQEKGLMWGFQLWVNLAAKDKMTKPRYQEIKGADIPEVTRADGVRTKIIAGSLDGMTGPVSGIGVSPLYFDITVPKAVTFEHPLPEPHRGFLYMFEGKAEVGKGDKARIVPRGSLAVLGAGDSVRISASAGSDARMLFIAGRPLNEPVVKYGPFVMNTREQIYQAIDDFQSGRF